MSSSSSLQASQASNTLYLSRFTDLRHQLSVLRDPCYFYEFPLVSHVSHPSSEPYPCLKHSVMTPIQSRLVLSCLISSCTVWVCPDSSCSVPSCFVHPCLASSAWSSKPLMLRVRHFLYCFKSLQVSYSRRYPYIFRVCVKLYHLPRAEAKKCEMCLLGSGTQNVRVEVIGSRDLENYRLLSTQNDF